MMQTKNNEIRHTVTCLISALGKKIVLTTDLITIGETVMYFCIV